MNQNSPLESFPYILNYEHMPMSSCSASFSSRPDILRENLTSSVNSTRSELLLTISGTSFMNMVKRKGPSTDPCGTQFIVSPKRAKKKPSEQRL